MHTKPMSESEGTFTKTIPSLVPCRHCGRAEVRIETWESHCGGYEDDKYTCAACGFSWWVEGIDS